MIATKTKIRRTPFLWDRPGVVELAWLIHPDKREVVIYTKTGTRVLNAPSMLRGEGPVEGFELDIQPIWEDEDPDFE